MSTIENVFWPGRDVAAEPFRFCSAAGGMMGMLF